jgi:hypothetical protein
MGFDKNYF